MRSSGHNVVTYVGVDPGASGGIAVLSPSGSVRTWPMPATERDVWDVLCCLPPGCFGTIEKVGGFVAGNPAPGSAMFRFGASYGGLRMALIAAGVAFEEVTPQRWQRSLQLPPREKDAKKTDHKNALKARAQQLFPGVKVTLATADALLIVEYCRRKREGTLG